MILLDDKVISIVNTTYDSLLIFLMEGNAKYQLE